VVLGDAEEELSFANMNKAFQVLLNSERPLLISIGNGKFYQRADHGPCLDTGAYAALLKFALDGSKTKCEHVVMGKPEEEYFLTAVEDLGLTKEQVL
jgi:phospholysine phosphohistidine inorganic pyrophosphate phosphatase